MDREKKALRKEKRQVKRAGNKSRRRKFERDLRENPEQAHESEYRFGKKGSKRYNGLDRDPTRQPPKDLPE